MSDEDSGVEGLPDPPPPPDMPRRIKLNAAQWVGIPMMVLIPVLALVGVFGESRASASARTETVAVEVQYPTRYRYKMLNSLRLDVTNITAAVLDTVTISIDTTYASRFSTVVAIPAFEYPYVLELTDVEPGETRRVRVELQGEHYGRHRGELRVTAADADTARLALSTFIFP